MKIAQWYIPVVAPRCMKVISYCMNGSARGRAAAIFPFIIFRSKDEMVPWVINHERIHFAQQLDLLFIGTRILWVCETLYAVIWLRKSIFDAYTWRSCEQEAYRNQHDLTYLDNRKTFSQFRYLFHKREFTVGGPGEIVYEDSHGPK